MALAKRLSEREVPSSILGDLKAVYTTEKFGSGLLKKAVRTHNFCKETLEFLQG